MLRKTFHWPVGIVLLSLVILASKSHPMMYPGFDIWIHLSRIESAESSHRYWYQAWKTIFNLLGLTDVFDRALIIHRLQVFLAMGMIGLSAYWVMLVAFKNTIINKSIFALQAGCAVWIWLSMHGTVSTPLNGDRAFFQSWLMWYSVNYQITLPVYLMSASALLLAWFGDNQEKIRWLLLGLTSVGAIFITAIHASELSYLFFAIAWIFIIGFKPNLKWIYIFGIFLLITSAYIGIQFIGRLPTGLEILQSEGWTGLYKAIKGNGDWMINRGNRGQASFNYLYIMGLTSICLSMFFILRKPEVNIRPFWFVALSALPVFALYWDLSAGSMAMILYPQITWRFTFSSFLFLGIPLLVISLGLRYPKLINQWYQLLLTTGFVFLATLASYRYEPNHVTYQYARSIAYSLSPEKVFFGIPPDAKNWLKHANQLILNDNEQKPICTDIFSAYYLFFVHAQDRVLLPPHTGINTGACNFPRDGGDLKRFPIEPPPWTF